MCPEGSAGAPEVSWNNRLRPIRSNRDLIDYISYQPVGSDVRITLVRNGQRQTVSAKTAERQADRKHPFRQEDACGSGKCEHQDQKNCNKVATPGGSSAKDGGNRQQPWLSANGPKEEANQT